MVTLVTIWHTYGPYHLARVRALEAEFGAGSVLCFSHKSQDSVVYPFFNQTSDHHYVITPSHARIRFFMASWKTYQLLKKVAPDLVLSCGYERPETFGALLFTMVRRKTIILMLDNQYDDRRRVRLVEFVKRAYLKLFDGFIYGGDTHRDYLRILGVAPDRETYGYNCVDNKWIENEARITRGNRLAPYRDYFLCVARLVKKKNLSRLISAYKMYAEHHPDPESRWGLVIVGEGPERKTIEQQIVSENLESAVWLAGQVDKFEDVVNYHANARAVVLASHMDEQWGLVINEAMAAGRPVLVSHQCGCASSLVEEGGNGFTFDGRNPSQLAEHFMWMHRNEHLLEKMGERSREIVAKYSPAHFAENVKRLYGKMHQSRACQ